MEKDNTSVRSGEYIRVDYVTLSVRDSLGHTHSDIVIVVDQLRSGCEYGELSEASKSGASVLMH